MKFLFALSAVALCGLKAYATEPIAELPRSTPEMQGVSSTGVLDFIDSADKKIESLHSFMMVRHGNVVAEGWWTPYNAESRHELYSLSKSFTSTAIGIAVDEGRLNLDDKVVSFFPNDIPSNPSEQLSKMRVRDLLSMSTGHTSEPRVGNSETWTKTFLKHEVSKEPGTQFLYNTPATYMLSAILQKQTGQTAREYLSTRLFNPLAIKDPTWGTSPQGVSLGGYGLSVRTEDIAKFGQLYLQHGKWNGQQLVSPEWIDQATSKQVSNGTSPESDWNQGYGFQFWRCRHDAFRGDGAFGQYCIVLPKQDTVIAITSGVKDMQSVLNLVWDKILPAIHAEALPENKPDSEKLKSKLSSLVLPLQSGKASTPASANYVGKQYSFSENSQHLKGLRLEAGSDGATTLIVDSSFKEQRIECVPGKWSNNKLSLGGWPVQPISTCGAWTSDSELTVKACLFETPFTLTWKLQFKGDELLFDSESDLGFGQTKYEQLVGKKKN